MIIATASLLVYTEMSRKRRRADDSELESEADPQESDLDDLPELSLLDEESADDSEREGVVEQTDEHGERSGSDGGSGTAGSSSDSDLCDQRDEHAGSSNDDSSGRDLDKRKRRRGSDDDSQESEVGNDFDESESEDTAETIKRKELAHLHAIESGRLLKRKNRRGRGDNGDSGSSDESSESNKTSSDRSDGDSSSSGSSSSSSNDNRKDNKRANGDHEQKPGQGKERKRESKEDVPATRRKPPAGDQEGKLRAKAIKKKEKADLKAAEQRRRGEYLSFYNFEVSKIKRLDFEVTCNVTGEESMHLYRFAIAQHTLAKIMDFNGYVQQSFAGNGAVPRQGEIKLGSNIDFMNEFKEYQAKDPIHLNELRKRMNSVWLPTNRTRSKNYGPIMVIFSCVAGTAGIPQLNDVINTMIKSQYHHCVVVFQQEMSNIAKQKRAQIMEKLSHPLTQRKDGTWDNSESAVITTFTEDKLQVDILNDLPHIVPKFRLVHDNEKKREYFNRLKTDPDKFDMPRVRLGGTMASVIIPEPECGDLLETWQPHPGSGTEVVIRQFQKDAIDALGDAQSLTKGKKTASKESDGKR